MIFKTNLFNFTRLLYPCIFPCRYFVYFSNRTVYTMHVISYIQVHIFENTSIFMSNGVRYNRRKKKHQNSSCKDMHALDGKWYGSCRIYIFLYVHRILSLSIDLLCYISYIHSQYVLLKKKKEISSKITTASQISIFHKFSTLICDYLTITSEMVSVNRNFTLPIHRIIIS